MLYLSDLLVKFQELLVLLGHMKSKQFTRSRLIKVLSAANHFPDGRQFSQFSKIFVSSIQPLSNLNHSSLHMKDSHHWLNWHEYGFLSNRHILLPCFCNNCILSVCNLYINACIARCNGRSFHPYENMTKNDNVYVISNQIFLISLEASSLSLLLQKSVSLQRRINIERNIIETPS